MDCLARIETFVKLVETRGFTALQSPPGCMMAAGTDNETTSGDARRQFEFHLRPHPQHHVAQLARPTRKTQWTTTAGGKAGRPTDSDRNAEYA